jgi:hypothetical protein
MTGYLGTIEALGTDGEVLDSMRALLGSKASQNGQGWGGTFTLETAPRSPEWIRNAYALRLPVTIRTATGRTGTVLINELWRRSFNPWQAKVTGTGSVPFD